MKLENPINGQKELHVMKHTRYARFLTLATAFLALGAISASALSVVTCYSNDCPPSRVPDSGTMIPMLGMALMAADALRRKLQS
jgi:hypothetical protein